MRLIDVKHMTPASHPTSVRVLRDACDVLGGWCDRAHPAILVGWPLGEPCVLNLGGKEKGEILPSEALNSEAIHERVSHTLTFTSNRKLAESQGSRCHHEPTDAAKQTRPSHLISVHVLRDACDVLGGWRDRCEHPGTRDGWPSLGAPCVLNLREEEKWQMLKCAQRIQSRSFASKAWVKRRTSHEPNLMTALADLIYKVRPVGSKAEFIRPNQIENYRKRFWRGQRIQWFN